ncbi:MAG: hypothetical protein GF307_12900 [candidate division Zixibacteria bacterium]|nr:hypothetical protein [candidate division Zixibacteria bacterium]
MGLSDIFKPAYRSKDPEKRLEAVKELSEQDILAELAMKDKSPRVRMAAIARVEDQGLLMKIALDGDELDSRIAAVERIKSQEKIAEIIKARKNYELMGACFAQITSKAILEKIANDPGYNRSARRIAIENYADESVLADFEKREVDRSEPKSADEISDYIRKYGGDKLVRTLGKFKGSKNSIITLGNIANMGDDASPQAVEYLTRALKHSNPEISDTAVEQLSRLKDPDLIARMVSMIDDAGLHGKIIQVLKKIDHPEAQEFLKKYE